MSKDPCRFILAVLVVAVCAASADARATEASIGTAQMASDGTLTFFLIARDPARGITGHGFFTYKRGDPKYGEMLRHVGGLRPGQTKSVPPWPSAAK
ncbi:hypothetical protein [Lichenifustis flavocetrariae]|uniref:Uncharacterized protein n=1 Tax=Lichenifustis flavocetrariae TaxID=2949735 RepID=A0AA42CR76_9HYPH|nr:hypothetical protein [Lichenifustis flavocetrariae]MCW6512197.1 hypothetical protein [Lichenifustis flavocetrariae]